MVRIAIKLKPFIINQILRFKRIPVDQNLLIFSDPRGGSIWLMEMLLQIPKTVAIWEPFHVNNGVIPESFKFGWRPYVPEDCSRGDIKSLFTSVLSGENNNVWTIRDSKIVDYLKAEKLIFKFVRINSMLPWLTKNFRFKHKPIYLLRHPVAVALSQIKAFHQNESFQQFEIPDVVFNEKYILHQEFLKSLTSPFEKYIAEWCLHNADTIKHSRANKDWIVVYYEDLLVAPQIQLKRIFKELNIELNSGVYSNARKPSQMVYKNDFYKESKNQLIKWVDRATASDLEKGEIVLKYFDIKEYSCFNPLPNK